jgi:hypothetical protein
MEDFTLLLFGVYTHYTLILRLSQRLALLQ